MTLVQLGGKAVSHLLGAARASPLETETLSVGSSALAAQVRRTMNMQSYMPDFKKYFPNCEASEGGVPAERMQADGSDVPRPSPSVTDRCIIASNKSFSMPAGSPALQPSNEKLANAFRATPNAPSKLGLVCFCVVGWFFAFLGFFLWLFR